MPEKSDEQTFQYWDGRAKTIVATYMDHGFEPKKAELFKKMDIIIKQSEGTKGSVKAINEFEALVDELNQIAVEPKRAIDKFWAESSKALSPNDIRKIEAILKPFEASVDNALQTAEEIKTKLAEMRAEFD